MLGPDQIPITPDRPFNTKMIMKQLYIIQHRLKDLPTENNPELEKALDQAIALDAKIAKVKQNLDTPSRLTETKEATSRTIKEIKTKFQATIEQDFKDLEQPISQLNAKLVDIKTAQAKLLETQNETIPNLFKEKKPVGEIMEALRKFREEQKKHSQEVKAYRTSYRDTLRKLDKVHADAYNNVSATEKEKLRQEKVTVPEREKISVRRPQGG